MPSKKPSPSAQWEPAIAHLSRVDPVLRKIIAAVGPCTLKPRRDYFVVLSKAIFSQQISTVVAATLFKRFCRKFPAGRPTPQRVIDQILALPPGMGYAGLSRQKMAYILDLARHFATGKIPTAQLSKMDDEEVIQALTQVHGIGRWTAEMFLMFVLNRLDVLPVDDFGLRQSAMIAYKMNTMPKPAQLKKLGEKWHPYSTVATWYLWKMSRPGKATPAVRGTTPNRR